MFLSPANDFHGRINDLQLAVQEIQSSDWRVTCAAHHNHQDTDEYEVATQIWFDQYLKGSRVLPQTPKTALRLTTADGMPLLTVNPDSKTPVQSVGIFYTQQGQTNGLKDDSVNTKHRFWHYAKPKEADGGWLAELPLSTTDAPLWVYANVLYRLDAPITGAGYYYGAYTTDRFNLSSQMHMIARDELKKAGAKATLQPTPEIETFKGDWEKEWFTYKPEEWGRKTHKVYHPLWAAPGANAKLSLEIRAAEANNLIVGIDHYGAEVKLHGGNEWQTITLSASDFTDAHEAPLSSWNNIKELRLGAQDRLRSAKRGDKTSRALGGAWRGAPPAFRALRWL
jgi:hypothetical protein